MSFNEVWEKLIVLQDTTFITAQGKPYQYSLSGGVMHVSRKANPITKATVEYVVERAVELNGIVPGPKALKCFGASYLYPILIEIGVVKAESQKIIKEELEENVMPRPKGSKNKSNSMTLDERINAAEARVAELKEQLTSAEAELKSLYTLRDEAAMKDLLSAIAKSGKSVSDVIEMLTEGNNRVGTPVDQTVEA